MQREDDMRKSIMLLLVMALLVVAFAPAAFAGGNECEALGGQNFGQVHSSLAKAGAEVKNGPGSVFSYTVHADLFGPTPGAHLGASICR